MRSVEERIDYHRAAEEEVFAAMGKPRVDPDGIDPPVPVSGPVCQAELPRRIHVEVPGKDEDVQFRLCDGAALSGSDAQRVKECLPLVWAEDAKIRARSREVFSQAIHEINGSLQWPRKPLPRVPNPYIVEGACQGETAGSVR